MGDNRKQLYQELESVLDTNLLVYVTGDRPGYETQIASDAIDLFIEHLDAIGVVPKISLFLYTRGGHTLAGWNIVNLIRQFCDEFEVIISHKAHSTGTLISIGADRIIMTKQATLGPIDPSVNTPLNPNINNGRPDVRMPVSVEALNSFLDVAKKELNINDDNALANILTKLSETVHPLVIGEAYRARNQIQMLAKKLLVQQVKNTEDINNIISFLCSDSGSHDYTINRVEAKENLGLNVVKPNDNEYSIIRSIHNDISAELGLRKPFDLNQLMNDSSNGEYAITRSIVESIKGGKDYFVSRGVLNAVAVQNGRGINDNRTFEGWLHEK